MTSSRGINVLKEPQLADYTFTVKLGQGAYGSVYKAFRKVGQREVVAIKCILKSSLNSVSKENILTEIEVLKSLKHKHIIQLKDFMWDDNFIYIVMDYCGGGALSEYLKKFRIIPENVAKFFLQQLASALQYMRSKSISHMDLKPSNILLTSSQNSILKIGDFGFAHHLEGQTEAMYLRGSLLYMAPEIITQRSYNEKADLWSVGIILYECVFGRTPFQSSSERDLMSKLRSDVPVQLPMGSTVSSSCRDFLSGLLQRDPHQRMGYNEFFAHPFIDFEHIPSEDSIIRALELVRVAMVKDDDGDLHGAMDFYCQSIEYFMAAIKFTNDDKEKDAIRTKVNRYIVRAEELKTKPSLPESPAEIPGGSHEVETEAVQQSKHKDRFISALNIIKAAEAKEFAEEYEAALERYEAGLGALLNILKDEPESPRKERILSQMSLWMSKAEHLKQYLTINRLKARNALMESESRTYMCGIQ